MIEQRLRELAEKATAVRWDPCSWYQPSYLTGLLGNSNPKTNDADAAYIAALSPDTVLRLLDVVEKARDAVDEARAYLTNSRRWGNPRTEPDTDPVTLTVARLGQVLSRLDFWVGVFVDRAARAVYVCPLPMLVIRIAIHSGGER